MNLGDPRKRKPIHDKVPLDEIRDNVKNDAVLTRSRSKIKYKSSHSGNEELFDLESSKELHLTFRIDSSPQNFARRNSGTNMNGISRTKWNQSPEVHKKKLNNSYSNDDDDDEDDDDISNDEEDREDSFINRSSGSGIHRTARIKSSPIYIPESMQYSKCSNITKRSKLPSKNLNESTSNSKSIYFLMALIVGCIVLYFVINSKNSVDIGTQTEAIDEGSESQVLNNVLITFKNMQSKYKNQNRDLWLDAYSSIATLITQERKRPSIIVLLGNKSNPLECLARLLGNVSSKALRSDRLVLTPKEFEADMGSVIQTMRSHLKDNKAIIVSDLLNINVEALKAFHNLCDRINPLVEEAIYIITVIADDFDDYSKPLQYIETQLYKKLSGKMKEDAIQPLITRLTDGPILTVKPEPSITDCSL